MEKDLTISNLEFIPVSRPESGLLGFLSFKYAGFSFQGVGVHSVLNPNPQNDAKIKLVFPAKRVGARHLFYFRPLTPELETELRKATEQKLEELNFFKP